MKIGYPCMNRSIGCTSGSTFRLASYSKERLIEVVGNNLCCLEKILHWNVDHGILNFRMTSDLVPFASHPVCRFKWQDYFKRDFSRIGRFIRKHGIRISMHPDQFTLINARDRDILRRSVRELQYHAEVLDLMQLNRTAKIQIHVGGVYGDKSKSMERFVRNYMKLDAMIRKRLVVENDDRSYTLTDCLWISKETEVPVLFDVFHHQINCSGESVDEALRLAGKTWKKSDGLPMVDYSSQKKDGRRGAHAEQMDVRGFKRFLKAGQGYDVDVMLEIKEKERAALKALRIRHA